MYTSLHRASNHVIDLSFVCFLTRYCFVCPILLGQVGIRQNGQITLAAMVETTTQKIAVYDVIRHIVLFSH